MTTIADKLTLLANTKAAIETAIEAKGVDVPAGLPFSGYPAKIAAIQSGGRGSWQPHPDWIDISAVGDNEINLLVSDDCIGVAFKVNLSGTYSIDWGDGNIETLIASGTVKQHQYVVGSGQSVNNGQYSVFKVKIYNATGNISIFNVDRHNYSLKPQYSPILWAVFGTLNLSTFAYAFYNSSGVYCYKLQSVTIKSLSSCASCASSFFYCISLQNVDLPVSWGNVLITMAMFQYCQSLKTIKLPDSWGSITNCGAMFYLCYSLESVNLPVSWGNVITPSYFFSGCSALVDVELPASWGLVTDISGFFNNCYSLSSVKLPTSWGNVNKIQSLFSGCYSLVKVVLPTSYGNITSCNTVFYGCVSLRQVDNIEYVGSTVNQGDFYAFLQDCEVLTGVITIGSRLSRIGIYGSSGYLMKITGIRLTNPNSTFTSSPNVNISYTSLDATALNTLFGDLPTLSGKTINITGCPGAATCDRSIATAKGWTVTG